MLLHHVIWLLHSSIVLDAITTDSEKIQQQQQHSLLSQASWDRLEMKPKRHTGHGSGTLIASLQALLSKTTSSEISQSLRSLLTDSSQSEKIQKIKKNTVTDGVACPFCLLLQNMGYGSCLPHVLLLQNRGYAV